MKVAIIGGSGKMGRWFASFLSADGKEVIIVGRDENKLLEVKRQLGVEVTRDIGAVRNADVVLISVPVDSFEEVVECLAGYINHEQVIVDISSVKVFPVEIMHKHLKTGKVLGTHPVFGPGARSIVNQNIVLTPTNNSEQTLAQKIRGYLEAKEARVTLMTPEEHDEMMSVILGLSHFIALASADTLLSLNKLKQMEAIGGITYRVLLTLVESVISEDPNLYASLQMSLPNMKEVERLFRARAEAWAELVENKDRQQFVERMKNLRSEFEKKDPHFGRAYENMYKIVEGL